LLGLQVYSDTKNSGFKIYNPKYKVLPLNTQGVIHWELGFNYRDYLECFKLG